ncbi:HAMP domain-containing sensor histidine kinase [Temperatibacter marinus]|uniref:histidine kinase n=1 Tax=Temperatibacter marinus TaxID=1456591 RepID=A0AA52EBH7_9PROT|nr:HAMP domain-containing sensor histidine kinase [Temperatibacter marinus]WND01771.1 HAMP domain-containing sensor histidine kinase [Temperatibacter marinus]
MKKSIQPEFILKVCMIALVTSGVFIFMNFIFLFVVEDAFLSRNLNKEAQVLESHYSNAGSWKQPESKSMKRYETAASLPDNLERLMKEEPDRSEFYGQEGRHYHLATLSDGSYLVSEVSQQLLVRPMRKGLFVVYGVLSLLVTVIACLVAYGMARKTIRPITQLANEVASLEPSRAPETFAEGYPKNEIGQLAHQLENSMQRIYAFVQREQNFSRDVSHDLRTPLAVASGAIEILETQEETTQEQKALLERIKLSHVHMSLTVRALLSMARESSSVDLVDQKVMPIVEQTILQYGDRLEGKPVKLEVSVPYAATIAAANGVLEILLSNILGNAFQYTMEGAVHVTFKDGELTISDTAGGIPEALKSTLFEANSKSEHSSGYGLGLSIVKRLCEYHSIDLSITHLEGGTAISLKFNSKVS